MGKPLVGFIIGVAIINITAYLGGFDYNTRGNDAAFVFLSSFAGGFIGFILIKIFED